MQAKSSLISCLECSGLVNSFECEGRPVHSDIFQKHLLRSDVSPKNRCFRNSFHPSLFDGESLCNNIHSTRLSSKKFHCEMRCLACLIWKTLYYTKADPTKFVTRRLPPTFFCSRRISSEMPFFQTRVLHETQYSTIAPIMSTPPHLDVVTD